MIEITDKANVDRGDTPVLSAPICLFQAKPSKWIIWELQLFCGVLHSDPRRYSRGQLKFFDGSVIYD